MEQIALIAGQYVLYWKPLLLTAAALSAIFLFLALYLRKPGRAFSAACAVPMAIFAGILLSRLVHWYCRTDSYASLEAAMTDFSTGGYALLGVFAGCLITALLLRLVRISDSALEMLDCMAIAGSAGIAVGRMASFFDSSDRGPLMEQLELPWVWPVTNAVSGATEYRLATFSLQAMAAAAIFVIVVVCYLIQTWRKKHRAGDGWLLFLLLYGATQVVLDSTRYDSLAFRSNGFVGVVQVFAAIGMAVAAVVWSVRFVRLRSWRGWYIALWVASLGGLGLAGYMEYYVQRHGSKIAFSYSFMSLGLAIFICITLFIHLLTPAPEVKRRSGKFLKRSSCEPAQTVEEATYER